MIHLSLLFPGFSTTDGTIVSQVAYIAEFTLKCADGQAVPLFAQVGGVVSPIATVGENKFQVSITLVHVARNC